MLKQHCVDTILVEKHETVNTVNWVSLRQTGIMGPAMAKIKDAIMYHNCLDNVLEYVSDRDSGRCMRNLCKYTADGTLREDFWGHIYNIGGGESCRVNTYEMYQKMYGEIGFTDFSNIISPKDYATLNFHGQYYLDSDKLENYLHFRSDSMQYFYDAYIKEMGIAAPMAKVITKIPGGQKLMGAVIRKMFTKLGKTEHGTIHFIEDQVEDHIDAFWGSKERWGALPDNVNDMKHFTDWNTVVHIDHGYDESKPEEELNLFDMQGAAKFRGGECLDTQMEKGNWRKKMQFRCAFGHEFEASPRLVLEGGHWCPECERRSWNYGKRAKVDPFFAQVWSPLHNDDELREYPKEVTEIL